VDENEVVDVVEIVAAEVKTGAGEATTSDHEQTHLQVMCGQQDRSYPAME
jgi:hypothetical protein